MDAADRAFLTRLFEAAVRAADPETALRAHLPRAAEGADGGDRRGQGGGAAGGGLRAAVGRAADRAWWSRATAMAAPCRTIRVLEAAHPVPDAAGLAATAALFEAVQGLRADDLVVALVCGGGSALLPCAARGHGRWRMRRR